MEPLDISKLTAKTHQEQLQEIVDALPDGKCLPLRSVAKQIGTSPHNLYPIVARMGIGFRARVPGTQAPPAMMIANPRTVEAWKKANP